ncbi:craniofacial development protein 2-like [Plakobranchus ocellatus]|uniref:Craniofacial development protein 2-like n=1 Tax=Plakobranchus ocellatus TaxID=259542 RepID=A0AAV3ZG67_9GAST|nr:craniofacial development protein 2-like [Plakobranchus ocellatus]
MECADLISESQTGQRQEQMKRMNANILGPEVRWKGAGEARGQDYAMIYSGGNEYQCGDGLLLGNDHSNVIEEFWAVNDRITVANLNGIYYSYIEIIQAYAPTADKDEEVEEQFYEDVDKSLRQLKSQDIKIVIEDFNSKLGKKDWEHRCPF